MRAVDEDSSNPMGALVLMIEATYLPALSEIRPKGGSRFSVANKIYEVTSA
jgi:hypothetical protein